MNVSSSLVRAQSILFASLAVTLFVAFIAVLGKQWILYYKRASTWGSIVDRGKERQVKFVGLQKWGLHFIMELLPVLLQLAFLLFGIGLIVYLWDIDIAAAEVILVVTCFGCAFYSCIAVAATIRSDCPFQTPFSILLQKILPMIWPWMKDVAARARGVRVQLGRGFTALLVQIERLEGQGHLVSPIGRLCKTIFGEKTIAGPVVENVYAKHYSMKLSNPAFWRADPLFASPLPEGTAASAGFWLLENSTDFSAATAVAAVFSEFQWPSHHRSATALIRLRDAYTECFRASVFDRSARRKALQSAAAYFVLYRSRLIWSTSKSCEVEVEKLPSELPPDLLLYKYSEEWHGYDLFEYLLRIEDRLVPVESARFLSYIAPYWFCGDSDSAIKFRSSRLQTLGELIAVLEISGALVPATLTDCVLCVGAAMDFPLHPEDLIRVDKRYVPSPGKVKAVLIGDSDYLAPTFKMVVEHIHEIILAGSRRHRHAAQALEVLLALIKHTTLPLVDAAWIGVLLKRAAEGGADGDMTDEQFTLFLRLSSRRTEEDATVDTGLGDFVLIQGFGTDPQSLRATMTSAVHTLDDTLFSQVMKNIQTCVERDHDWQDEAIYGGLIAIRDMRQLEPSLFDDDTVQTLHNAMNHGNPFRVRQAAYDVMLVTRHQWLTSEGLRQKLEDLGFFRQLHRVVIEIARPDYQRSFLVMMEILSEDEYWHSYLREAMDIWLRLRHEGQEQTLHILDNVGEMLLPRVGGYSSSSFDEFLQRLVVEEWASVPGRFVYDLTADRLKPLAEVTGRFKELLFNESYWKEVLAAVQLVIPGLEQRCEDGYDGPGEDVRRIINDLLAALQLPPQRRFSYD